MIGQPRVDDLRRRVEADPTSIAFAALAEEYRRTGQFREAVAVCRRGLTRHPAYLSARVTLGRALLALGDLDGAEAELQLVRRTAPDNLAAVRALTDVQARRGPSASGLVLPAAPNDFSEPRSNTALVSLDRLLHAIVALRSIPV